MDTCTMYKPTAKPPTDGPAFKGPEQKAWAAECKAWSQWHAVHGHSYEKCPDCINCIHCPHLSDHTVHFVDEGTCVHGA